MNNIPRTGPSPIARTTSKGERRGLPNLPSPRDVLKGLTKRQKVTLKDKDIKCVLQGLSLKSTMLMNHTNPEAVFSVLTDFMNYPKQHGPMEHVQILDRSDVTKPKVQYTINICGVKEVQTLNYQLDKQKNTMSWTLENSTFLSKNTGTYSVTPTDNGVKLSHCLELSMGKSLKARLGNILLKAGAEKDAKKTYHEICQELNNRR